MWIAFSSHTLAGAEQSEEYEEARREKARRYCKLNPLEEKCKKFLDSEYRLLRDAEKEDRETVSHKKLDQKYEIEIKRELITFCRKNPDSSRCK